MNIFLKNSEFDLMNIKITVYIFQIVIDFFLNAIFYSDNIVSEKYENGKLSFLNEFKKSLYLSLIGLLFSIIINNFSNYTYYF